MEEPELRVGGWEKKSGSRFFRRLFNLILVLGICFAIIGPSAINYNPAYIPSDSLYLANGMWNGPFDTEYSKEFAGHIKVSSVTYETTVDESGELRVISMSSFINLENVDFQSRVIEVVEEEVKTSDRSIRLINNGFVIDEELELPAGYSIYQWTACIEVTNGVCATDPFDDDVYELTVRAIFWNEKDEYILDNLGNYYRQYQTVICIIFAESGTSISQATELIKDVI